MYQIRYTYKSANDKIISKTITADTPEQAETICENIEALADEGYKLVDVTKWPA
jgi:hypothetical protein